MEMAALTKEIQRYDVNGVFVSHLPEFLGLLSFFADVYKPQTDGNRLLPI